VPLLSQLLGQEIAKSSMSTPSAIEVDTSGLLIAMRLAGLSARLINPLVEWE
jgi:hypothetical protein